ncbi:small nuclear ribonucleoprotein 35kDa (U11 U12) [Mactra antiquata]
MDWRPIPKKYDPLKAGSIDGTDDYPHDKAVSRAMCAKYKPNKSVQGNPEHTIFVGQLSPHTDEDSLGYVFSDFGEIKRLRLVRDIVTGFSRCYAFIEYFDYNSAYKAQRDVHGTLIDEKEVYVDFECERKLEGWVPRRLGGGIGGKKESGQLRFGGKSRPFKKPFDVNSIQKPQGDTFRDRLHAVERGDKNSKFGGRWDRNDDRRGQSDNFHRYDSSYRSRSPYRKRSRSRERDSKSHHSKRRSRSRDRR